MLVSSNLALLAQIRDAASRDEKIAEAYSSGALQIKALHEVVRMFADAAGVPLATIAGPEHQAALLGNVCTELSEESPFAKARFLPGFHKALVSVLRELRHARIETSTAASASEKLAELAIIDDKFQAAMLSNRLTTLSERIEKSLAETPVKPLELEHLYWVGETEMDALLIDFASWVMSVGVKVTFLVEQHPDDDGFFPVLGNLTRAFPELKQQDVRIEAPAGCALFGQSKPGARRGRIEIVESADDFVETEWAIGEAAKRLESGASPGSICIYAKSLERYGPLLQTAALRIGVPLAMARRERIDTNSFAQQVLLGLDACVSNSMVDVANLAANIYGGVQKTQRDAVSDAIRLCRRNEEPWTALKEAAMNGTVPKWLERFSSWRDKAATLRVPLAEWIRGLDILISSTPWLEAGTTEDHSAQDAMIRALAVRKFVEGSRPISLREFAMICSQCWRDSEYSIRTQNGVRVITSPFAVGEAVVVFVLGAVESSIPGRRAEEPVLLDRDRKALAAINGDWALPTSYERSDEKRRDFYRLMCSCGDIVLTHPARTDENDEVPSAFLDDLSAAGLVVQSAVIPYEHRFPLPSAQVSPALLPAAMAWHPEHGFDAGEAISAKLATLREEVAQASSHAITDESVRAELAKLPAPLRFRHLRSLRRCNFQYAAVAKLGLSAKRQRWAWSSLADVVRRTDLNVPTKEHLELALWTSLNEVLTELQGIVPDEELEMVEIAAPRVLSEFATREFDAREKWGLTLAKQNVSLDDAEMNSAIPDGGARIEFDASLDAVYKTADGLPVPMRFASLDQVDFTDEAGLLMLLAKGNPSEHMAILDSLGAGERKAMVRRKDGIRAQLKAKGTLTTDTKSESSNVTRKQVHDEVRKLLRIAQSGDITPSPGSHCKFCDFGSLCRSAPEGNLHTDPWESLGDDE